MATSRQVKCISKNDKLNRRERITHIGGDWGFGNTRIKITEAQAIEDIEQDNYAYHVKVDQRDVKVIIAVYSGRKYLKTESDTTIVNDLLSLSEC